jgi:polyphosphate:AMP phosphotransferase
MSMFKAAEIGAEMSDAQFRGLKDRLRLDLIKVQQQARSLAKFPIVMLLSGVRGSGVIDTLNLLNTWMDPRWIQSHAFDGPTDEERGRPPLWRHWCSLPANGTAGLYLGGWYSDPIAAFAAGKQSRAAFAYQLREAAAFERSLTDNGALVLKFWLHVDEARHRAASNVHRVDPLLGFRTSDAAWPQPAPYKRYVSAAAVAVADTHVPAAPWHVVEGADDNFRRASVLTILRDSLAAHIKAWKKRKTHGDIPGARGATPPPRIKNAPSLAKADLSKSLTDRAYCRAFPQEQSRVYAAQKAARAAGLPCVIAFEGWDAAGKGGAIRRLTYSLNAFSYRVVPIAAPTEDELAHHYLWRFWRPLPHAGHVALFDRTWYGRVLVERVEKLIPKPAWTRAYGEIRDFEDSLIENGTLLIKFWMHISKKEQKRRLEEREETPHKQWKLNDEDWHAHKKYDDYYEAAEDMLARTSTARAPWHVIPAEDKHYARITVLDTVASTLEKALAKKRKR